MSISVSELAVGDVLYNNIFLLSDFSIKAGKLGSRYLSLKLSDRTGTIPSALWENKDLGIVFPEDLDSHFQINGFVKVQGIVKQMPEDRGGRKYVQLNLVKVIDQEYEF